MNSTLPNDFVYRPSMSADEIPCVQVSPTELGITDLVRPAEYTRVPSASYVLFPPASRLVLCLIFARDVFGEDAPGGWTKLSRGLTDRFSLGDKSVRKRAVASVERSGVAEVRRRRGAATLLRLKA